MLMVGVDELDSESLKIKGRKGGMKIEEKDLSMAILWISDFTSVRIFCT
jgi:hypothetical protein